MSRYLVRRIEEIRNLTLHRRTQIVALGGDRNLERVTWRDDSSGKETTHAIRHVFSMTGAAPNTDWLRGCVAPDERGFILAGSDLRRDVLERWLPGLYQDETFTRWVPPPFLRSRGHGHAYGREIAPNQAGPNFCT